MQQKQFLFLLMSGLCAIGSQAKDVSIYSDNFDDESTYGNYVIIDANDDGKTWTLKVDPFSPGVGTATAQYNPQESSDDWLFIPSVALKAGVDYTLSFDMYGGLSFCTEKAEVMIGSAPTVEAMTKVLLEPVSFNTTSATSSRTEIKFQVEKDGDYSIGFHAISDKDQFGVILDNVELTGPGEESSEPTVVELPYTQTFDNAASFDDLTVINANNDFKEWEYQDGKATLQYNSNEAADDWLILPGINMTEGMGYNIQFDAWSHIGNQYPERIEVKYGLAPTAEGMTDVIMNPTLLENKENEPIHFEYTVKPSATGIYYIGFHGISDPDQSKLFLDNINVTEKNLAVPVAPTSLTVTPDPMGSNKTTVSLTAPDKDLAGKAVTALEKVEIIRGESVIKTFENPTPGEELTYVDEGASRGLTNYHAVAYTAAGRGEEAFTTVFVGINTPAPVPSVTVVESESKPGQVTLTWEVPTVDVDGNPINTDLITYEVVERNGIYTQNVIKSGIKGTSYTYQALPANENQKFLQWGVYSYTENGTKHDTRTDLKAIGKPYAAPFTESFANGEASSILSNQFEGVDTNWILYTDEDKLGARAQDGDNGFSGFVSESQGDFAQLTLGKVSLDGIKNPALTFYLFNPTGSLGAIDDLFEIDLYVDNEWKPIYETTLASLVKQNQWNRIVVPLQEYAGKTVQVRFLTGIINGGMILVDNVSIGELYKQNAAATAVTVPAQVKPNKEFDVEVTIENLGSEAFDNYSVTLFRGDNEIATLPGTKIEPSAETSVKFTDKLGVASDDQVIYSAVLNADHDEYAADNQSRTATTTLVRSTLPAPDQLQTSVEKNTVTLTWNEPDLSSLDKQEVTESFEDGTPWTIDDFAAWTFYDGDGAETYSFSGYSFPGKNEKMAYQIFDSASDPFATETGFDAASGSKYLISFCSKAGQNDDWAISPELSGNAQTVTLMASSFNVGGGFYHYYESFEVLYSTTGKGIDDFVLAGEAVDEVPETWTKYSFNLPEGAKYFAIRCTSKDKYAFMVDDVTYSPKPTITSDSFAGYNIYRDGVCLNETPVKETSYVDNMVDKGDYTYVVTAVFGDEESNISNLATAIVTEPLGSGVDAIFSDDEELVIYDLMGRRLTKPVKGVNIINGKKVIIK